MATGKKYYWLKLQRDFFKRHDIRIIERQTNGKDYIIFYLKLLTESIDHEGRLRFSDSVPYDVEMLSVITDTNVDVCRSAVDAFLTMGLMELWDDGTYYMVKVEDMIGSQSESTERVAAFREKRKQIEAHIPRIESHTNNQRYGGNYYKAFERDGGVCLNCGSNEKLVMHHITAYNPTDPETVKLNNLMLLCPSCHVSLHKNKPQADMPKVELLQKVGYGKFHDRYTPLHVTQNPLNVTQELETELEKEKEKDKKPPNPLRGGKGLNYDFIEDEEWRKLYRFWAGNKKSPYRKQAGLEAGYRKLHILSTSNLEKATQIVDQSLANNWAGIFELKVGESGEDPEVKRRRILDAI